MFWTLWYEHIHALCAFCLSRCLTWDCRAVQGQCQPGDWDFLSRESGMGILKLLRTNPASYTTHSLCACRRRGTASLFHGLAHVSPLEAGLGTRPWARTSAHMAAPSRCCSTATKTLLVLSTCSLSLTAAWTNGCRQLSKSGSTCSKCLRRGLGARRDSRYVWQSLRAPRPSCFVSAPWPTIGS